MPLDSSDSHAHRSAAVRNARADALLKETVCWMSLAYVTLLACLFTGLALIAGGVAMALKFQGVVGTLFAGLIALAGFLMVGFLSRCLWVRFQPPAGIELAPDEHPDLHDFIRETGSLLGGVRFHHVILDRELDASVVQNPRLGVLGWYRNYLIIGLPLMDTLPAEEFRAVLAHEFAHMHGAQGKTSAWLNRSRTTWERVVAHMSSDRLCPILAKGFTWFWPRFDARMSLLSRCDELAADQTSAKTVSPSALANGLRRLAIQEERLAGQFLAPLERAVLGSAPLPTDMMESMVTLLRTNPEAGQAEQWLRRVLKKTATEQDTHPDLADRLACLGSTDENAFPFIRIAPETSATETFLRPYFLVKARATFSSQWLAEARRTREAGVGSENRGGGRTVKEAWSRIAALCRLDGLEKVQPEVLELLDRRPSHSGALFFRGCHLAAKGDPASTRFLEQAAEDPILSAGAYETLAQYHSRSGRETEAASLKKRAEQHQQDLRAALVERSQVTKNDCFLPHDLCPREIESLREALLREPVIRRAWAGSRQVKHFPSWRHLILILDIRWPAFKPVTGMMQQDLNSRILEHWETDGYVHIIRLDETNRPILKALRKGFADSELYRGH